MEPKWYLVKEYPDVIWFAAKDHKWTPFVNDAKAFDSEQEAINYETDEMKRCFRPPSQAVLM